MTVQELRKILEDYPSAMNIKIALGHQIADLNCVNSGVDMDTNQSSVWLCHERRQRCRLLMWILQIRSSFIRTLNDCFAAMTGWCPAGIGHTASPGMTQPLSRSNVDAVSAAKLVIRTSMERMPGVGRANPVFRFLRTEARCQVFLKSA